MTRQEDPIPAPQADTKDLESKVAHLELLIGSLVGLLVRKEIIGEEEYLNFVERTRTMRRDADAGDADKSVKNP